MTAELLRAEDLGWEAIERHPLQNGQSFAKLVARTPGIERSLDPIEPVVNCIDEGIDGGLRMAGSGILAKDSDQVIETWQRAGVQRVTSHSDCGAAARYAAQLGKPAELAFRLAAHRIQELAQLAKIEYGGHIDTHQLHRPEGHHIAFVAYYDGTGRFDASLAPGLPRGFTISRLTWGERGNPFGEADLAVQIAIGPHGWGRRFAETGRQFLLVPIGSPELSLDQLTAELSPLLATYGQQVRIDGFDGSPYLAR